MVSVQELCFIVNLIKFSNRFKYTNAKIDVDSIYIFRIQN